MPTANNTFAPANALQFLTMLSGHSNLSPRSEVHPEIVAELRPIVLAGGGSIRGWDINMAPPGAEGWRAFELRRGGHLVTRCYVAWTEEGGKAAWGKALDDANATFGAATTFPPALPWLSIVLLPGMVTLSPPAIMFEAGDLERCIAWTVIELFGKDGAHTPAASSTGIAEPGRGGDESDSLQGSETSTNSPIRLTEDGARLSIGPDGLTMIVQLSDPTVAEVADLRRGRLDIGVLSVGGTGFLLTRFGAAADTPRYPKQGPIVLECPFHIGLLPPDRQCLPKREAELTLGLTIVIQDQYGQQRGGRLVSLAYPTVEAIERIVERQRYEAAGSSWSARVHDAEIARFYVRNPDVARSADRLFAKAWASETVQ